MGGSSSKNSEKAQAAQEAKDGSFGRLHRVSGAVADPGLSYQRSEAEKAKQKASLARKSAGDGGMDQARLSLGQMSPVVKVSIDFFRPLCSCLTISLPRC